MVKKIEPIDVAEYFVDSKDKVFYQIVMSSRRAIETYLVTGNQKHFPIKEYVVTPLEMMTIIITKEMSSLPKP